MMGGVSPETCWAIKKHWNNKFYYTVASCRFFLWDLCYDAWIHEHQMYVSLHVKHRLLLADCNGSWIFSTVIRKILKCQISWKSILERLVTERKMCVLIFYTNCEKGAVNCGMSVRPSAWNNCAATVQSFAKFHIWELKKKPSRKFKLHYNLTTITGTLHEDRYTVLIISRSVLLRMRNVSDKSCTENQNTHFVFSNFFPKIVPFMR